MRDDLEASAEVWSLKLRNVVALIGQVTGFVVLLLGAFMMFRPLLAGLGVPVSTGPVPQLVQFYESLGLHWLALMLIGAITVWLTTR